MVDEGWICRAHKIAFASSLFNDVVAVETFLSFTGMSVSSAVIVVIDHVFSKAGFVLFAGRIGQSMRR